MKNTNTHETIDDSKKAFSKIVRLLNYCDRTSYELRERLVSAQFSERAANAAIEHAQELGFINDDRFTINYLEQAYRAGKGKRRVINELKQKGIEESNIEYNLENSSYADEDEEERALHFLKKHPPRGKNVQNNAFRKLIAKGYSVSAASIASRNYMSEVDN